ncbi:hypothetical protein Dda_5338 [Drechslerella dactyloides]|uniref:Zn(2)-C6 fungal-type domain-containing protein n=1 Tax=Drechslerella dactyloides TaxID=74499 RepID=A0AAD6IVX0_DREDA|nr:hypothetical protein Dda_5338 [Drechslerella dactyloides]
MASETSVTAAKPESVAKEGTMLAGTKRPAPVAGLNANGRPIKRRASKACQCCRARKVRCNVVEHGAPCTNCRLDNVDCIITESKRRSNAADKSGKAKKKAQVVVQPVSPSSSSHEELSEDREDHIPIFTYPPCPLDTIHENGHDRQKGSVPQFANQAAYNHMISQQPSPSTSTSSASRPIRVPSYEILTKDLPSYIKPTPTRLAPDDVDYLVRKGATSIPLETFRQELVDCYFAYVHPFMPLIEEAEWRKTTSRSWEGFDPTRHKDERVSLLLFQAVLFAGSAFVKMESLRAAGYTSRKSARKAFFQRTRMLYDFDWEQDRISLIQALLLMTYWYETPDDQKDTWHWMGVAISLSHTVGLHRNPVNSSLSPRRQKLWKRVWWSCFMRDRLVALGMRRPTRIKNEDCDVPMLTLEDFGFTPETDELADVLFGGDAEEVRRRRRERTLALMCIEKAKLVAGKDGTIDTTKNLMLLHPKKTDVEVCEVKLCDDQLSEWQRKLCREAYWRPANSLLEDMDPCVLLHRNLLHMVYFTTVSALHRPQVLPSAPAPWPARNRAPELQEVSRKKVRHAAHEITRLAEELIEYDLVRYLPTVGVTVMLPAVIIHLLDIKSSSAVTRELSLQGFGLCMQVMQGLRENYAAADFATHFLEAAVKKANIQIMVPNRQRFQTADDAMKALHRQRAMLVKRGVQIMQDNLYVPRSEGILGHVDMGVAVSVGPETPRDDMGLTDALDNNNLRERIAAFLNEESEIVREDNGVTSGEVPTNAIASAHPMNTSLNQLLFENPDTTGSMHIDNDNHSPRSLFVDENNDPFLGAYEVPGIGEGAAFSLDLSLMSGVVEDGGMDLLAAGQEGGAACDGIGAAKLMENIEFDFDKNRVYRFLEDVLNEVFDPRTISTSIGLGAMRKPAARPWDVELGTVEADESKIATSNATTASGLTPISEAKNNENSDRNAGVIDSDIIDSDVKDSDSIKRLLCEFAVTLDVAPLQNPA